MPFQEIVQNADDAGARQVKFMLDETQYGDKYLLPTEGGLEKYQVSTSVHISGGAIPIPKGLSFHSFGCVH